MGETTRLPGPMHDVWEWQYEGLCRTLDPDVFFHPEGERGPSRRRRAARAKAICAECPVLEQCREHALALREPYGVWGGMTEEERTAYLAGHEVGAPAPERAAAAPTATEPRPGR